MLRKKLYSTQKTKIGAVTVNSFNVIVVKINIKNGTNKEKAIPIQAKPEATNPSAGTYSDLSKSKSWLAISVPRSNWSSIKLAIPFPVKPVKFVLRSSIIANAPSK